MRPYDLRPTQSYLAVSLGGREDQCWNLSADPAKVLSAIADVKTHFNVAPRRVVAIGYSSGGELAYRTAFYNAGSFAGVLAMMTAPFSATGPGSQANSIAAASWRFHIAHIAHTSDTSYPLATVRAQTTALRDAGFPLSLTEFPGNHSASSDDAELLVARMSDPWLAPAP